MRQYEITYLISDDVAESEINKISGKINGYIADAKGKVLKEESWGRRKLAYPILKQQFATYITLNFELEPEKLRAIEKDIFHSPEILRHLTIVRTFGKEEMTLTAEDIAETEDITEVVGGEKSFEAIEGETEESRDLMAVRGEADESEEKEEMRNEETAKETEDDEKIEMGDEEKVAEESAEKVETEKPARKPRAKKVEKEEPKVEEIKVVKAEKEEEPSSAKATEGKKPVAKAPVSAKAVAAVGKVKTKAIKDDNVEDEADRLAKLDKELDDILGDDL